jgi:hypothetical protein
MPGSLALLIMPILHKLLSDNVDDNTDYCFLLINKSYWTVYVLQTSNNYYSQFPVSLGMKFHMEIFKHVVE